MLQQILQKIKDTHEYEILRALEQVYSGIEKREGEWKEKSKIRCPENCGRCCIHFEPYISEGEALYLAAWLLENEPGTAKAIIDGTFLAKPGVQKDGCPLFDPAGKHHCTVYGGRCLVCRLFGFSGDNGRQEERRFRPCKFLPPETLADHVPRLEHRQYEEWELRKIFGALPPAMSDFSEQTIEIEPGAESAPEPLRKALPKALAKLEFLLYAEEGKDPEKSDLPIET